jgi:diacylglycerol kinase family enzyme
LNRYPAKAGVQSCQTTPRQSGFSIDGEVLARTPATVEVAERAIEVVVPAETGISPTD